MGAKRHVTKEAYDFVKKYVVEHPEHKPKDDDVIAWKLNKSGITEKVLSESVISRIRNSKSYEDYLRKVNTHDHALDPVVEENDDSYVNDPLVKRIYTLLRQSNMMLNTQNHLLDAQNMELANTISIQLADICDKLSELLDVWKK